MQEEHTKRAVGDENIVTPTRRCFIKKTAAAAIVAAAGPGMLTKYARAAPRTIKVGLVSSQTGPLAAFAEADEFIIGGVRKAVKDGIMVNGVNHPVQILVKDSQSDPNRATQVTTELIKSDNVDLILTGGHLNTVNAVSDQAELNGVPCVATDAPWQAYFFGRGGKPDKGFDWTYLFFWGLEDLVAVYLDIWRRLPTNKIVGGLWPNDISGATFSDEKLGLPTPMRASGFTVVDPGRFDAATSDYSAQISVFKRSNVEIITGVLSPSAFSTFWSQAAQQNYKPKIATIAAALLFPAGVNILGDRGDGLTTEVFWSPAFPYKSGLTGQTAAQLAADWERETGKQWTQPMGPKHAVLEVGLDVLRRTKNIDSPEAIRDAILATDYHSMLGHVQWTGKPVKNVTKTPLVGGQWVKPKHSEKYKYDLLVVSNDTDPEIKIQAAMKSL
jgi:branched-chain amino acid transport system substrate-binding protein